MKLRFPSASRSASMNACSADVVDSAELASSLSVLCDGTSDEKARAVFALYNFDGDGVISLEEMQRGETKGYMHHPRKMRVR